MISLFTIIIHILGVLVGRVLSQKNKSGLKDTKNIFLTDSPYSAQLGTLMKSCSKTYMNPSLKQLSENSSWTAHKTPYPEAALNTSNGPQSHEISHLCDLVVEIKPLVQA